MDVPRMLLVSEEVLPAVFGRVVEAKRLLAVGRVKNLSEAAKASGISRSALYKYKDHVFTYDQTIDQSVITVNVYLEDRPGVLSALIDRRRGGPGVCLRPDGGREPAPGPAGADTGAGGRGGSQAGEFPITKEVVI